MGAELIIGRSEKHRKFRSKLITRANIIKIEDLEHILYWVKKQVDRRSLAEDVKVG